MASKKKIVMRRGAGIDLPGKPRKISPKEWNSSLDEGEVAFSSDTDRIFVGPNPESVLPQARRLQYPYRNIEIVGENSAEAFARMHGDRMREGDNRDYHTSILTPGDTLENLRPIGFVITKVLIASNITTFNGRRLKVFDIDVSENPLSSCSGRSVRSPTPARYWRVRSGINGGSTALVPMELLYINEIGLHETLGGPNIINQAAAISVEGGVGEGSTAYYSGDLPSYTVDGNSNTVFYGRRPDFDASYPLSFPPEGLAFDFGAGNAKWIAEASFVWGGNFTSTAFAINIEFSDDKINWTKAYRGISAWPVPTQLRYIPERIDQFPNNLTRYIGVHAYKNENASFVKISEISFHSVAGGPSLEVWAGSTVNLANDGSVLSEWVSDDPAMSASFRLKNKSTVVQIKVTGPSDPTQAPISIWFTWADYAYDYDDDATFSNLSWTPNEVKIFDITVVNNVTIDEALQLPLI